STFFLQAEDGIRYFHVTGVQTCALPISKHIQIEANMSLSGANADKRIPLTVSEQKLALGKIYNIITGNGVSVGTTPADAEITKRSEERRDRKESRNCR